LFFCPDNRKKREGLPLLPEYEENHSQASPEPEPETDDHYDPFD
jgi:hypothetical protein